MAVDSISYYIAVQLETNLNSQREVGTVKIQTLTIVFSFLIT